MANPTRFDREPLIETIKRNWALEMDGADMYGALAERERIPERKIIFQKLSALEKKIRPTADTDHFARQI